MRKLTVSTHEIHGPGLLQKTSRVCVALAAFDWPGISTRRTMEYIPRSTSESYRRTGYRWVSMDSTKCMVYGVLRTTTPIILQVTTGIPNQLIVCRLYCHPCSRTRRAIKPTPTLNCGQPLKNILKSIFDTGLPSQGRIISPNPTASADLPVCMHTQQVQAERPVRQEPSAWESCRNFVPAIRWKRTQRPQPMHHA